MIFDAQDGATALLMLAAATVLARRAIPLLRPRPGAGGCGGCAGCPQASASTAGPAVVSLGAMIRRSPPGGENG